MMPGKNGKGPCGAGPRTGRGKGRCKTDSASSIKEASQIKNDEAVDGHTDSYNQAHDGSCGHHGRHSGGHRRRRGRGQGRGELS